jgi:hypothetical protein
MTKKAFSARNLTLAAVVAALYAAVTLLFAPISYGPVQFRVSEALTLLPVLFPQAIPGVPDRQPPGQRDAVGRGFRDAGNADRRTRDPQVP